MTLDGQSATSTNHTTSIETTYGSNVPSITVPTRTGYTFGGYYSETNGGGTQYYTSAGASVSVWDSTSITKLYAKWTVNSYPYKVVHEQMATDGENLYTSRY